MSHSYGNGSSNTNTYLNKKRLEEDNQMEPRYHYDKYEKYDKYTTHPRYNNMNYMHSKQATTNNYYNSNSRYKNNYYNNSKNYRNNSYGNKISNKRDYKKPYQKFNTANVNEGIRNLSHCELPSSPNLSEQKPKNEEISEKNISPLTNADSNNNSNNLSNDGINIKDLNKFVNNITSHIPQNKNQNYQQQIFQTNQQNINIEIHLSSQANLKFNKEKQTNLQKKDEDFSPLKIPKPSQKINIEPFNRKTIKIEENPIDNFDAYPKNPYDINLNINKKNPPTPINESIHNDNLDNALSVKSSYLLAKIPNWRLVTNFVPASALTEEKFENIICLEEKNDKSALKEKKNDGMKILIKDEKMRKSHVVYMEKYEDAVEKSIELNKNSKKKINTDIFNIKSIIEQYHYDILKVKNKIKQNEFKTNYLSNKLDSLAKAIDDNTKE